jgi:uroporphyrinogen-III synthase
MSSTANPPSIDGGALRGKRVLITRPEHQAEAFARALRERGAEPLFGASIAVGPPDDPRPAHRAIDELSTYAWVVFNSSNGVDAFFDRLDSLDSDARYLAHTRVAAIGTATAQRLRERGIRADLVPAEFVSEEIARALIEAAGHGDRILIYRAQEARNVLPEMLEEAGLRVTVVAAYKTRPVHDPALHTTVETADAVTFTSASSVRGFAESLGGDARAVESLRGKAVACIGPVTAEAARDCGLHVDTVAEVFTTAGLIDALEAYFATHG